MNSVIINGVTTPRCFFKERTVDLRSIDRVHDMPKGTSRQAFESLCKKGVLVKDKNYLSISKELFKEESGTKMAGRGDQPIIVLNKNGYDNIIKSVGRKRNINKDIVQEMYEKFFEVPVERHDNENHIAQDNIELANEVKRLTLLVEQMLNKMSMMTVAPTVDVAVEERTVEPVTFEEWAKPIDYALDNVMKATGITKRKIILNKAYNMMRNQYGIVWEQERKEYYEANGEYPLSTFHLAYWIEQKNPSCKNLLYVCVMHFNEEGIVTHLTMPKKVIPSLDGIDNMDKVREIIDHIGKETNCGVKNYAPIWKSLKCYVEANCGLDLAMIEMCYRIDNRIYPNEKLTVLDYMFSAEQLAKLMPDLFKSWANDKYGTCFEQ